MMTEIPVPEETPEETKTITEGYFEEELYIDAESAGAFLIELGKQLRDQDEITLTGDGWEIPFAFREPVELDIEFEGDDAPELEIELELKGRRTDDAPGLA